MDTSRKRIQNSGPGNISYKGVLLREVWLDFVDKAALQFNGSKFKRRF